MRGRRPKPTALKRLAGNPGKRRLNHREPTPARTSLVEPPALLGAAARQAWVELVPELQACGLLTVVDLPKLELLAVHLGLHRKLTGQVERFRKRGKDAAMELARLLRALRQEAEIVRSLAVGFGLDPADRGRLHVDRAERGRLHVDRAPTDDPFAEFDNMPVMKPRRTVQ